MAHNTNLSGQREKDLQQLIDCLPIMVAYVDHTKTYRVVNSAYHDFFGVQENRLAGKHASEVMGNPLYNVVEKYIDTALAGKPATWESCHTDPNTGKQCILLFRLVPYAGNHCTQDTGCLVVVEDITEMKRINLMLKSLNQSLEQQVEQRTAQLQNELQRRKKLEKQLRLLADHDSLTGLLNRRAFIERMNDEIRRSQRYGTDLTYMIIDIDKFKSINDTHGHMTGDAVLKAFSKKITQIIRNSDFVGRIGGEEFAIVLPGTSLALANEMGERICKDMEKHTIRYRNIDISCTVSIGISRYLPSHQDGDIMHSLADAALYQAKNSGRNRVCVATEYAGRQTG